ncbi:MAG TPA: hypothetical protein VHJ17_09375 [Thermomonospora sp.]|nr:hypothetical protein [Thermomonospora sp.]
MTARRLGILAIVWLWMPLLLGLFWAALAVLAEGVAFRQTLRLWMFRNGWPDGWPTGWLWLWIAIGLAISIGVFLYDDDMTDFADPAVAPALVTTVALALVAVWALPVAVWDNDKEAARYYNAATVFHVPSLSDPPDALARLLEGSRAGRPGCDRVGGHDVPSCVVVDDTLSGLRWESRTSSLASAVTAMNSAASLVPGVDVFEPTLTYQWGATPNTGQWSAILHGHGVATWDGTTNSARTCRYTGGYRLNRRFDRNGRHSLRARLAERFPDLTYADTDVWGYCEKDRPVIVIPALREIGYHGRTVLTSGGVIVVRGSADGRPAMSHHARVRPGEFPGPVIPKVLAERQWDAAQWAAGRRHRDEGFGFVQTTFETQKANPGEYLLRGHDKRLYYVTPLTPRKSKSQSFVAYGIMRADEAVSGRLNRYDIHVPARGGRDVVNLAAMHAKAVNVLTAAGSAHANFLNSGGRLEQYIPLGGGTWRVYGVQNGQTIFYMDLSADDQFQPRTVTVGTREQPPKTGGERPSPGGTTDCGKPLDQLDDRQLADCLGDFADELRRRARER